MAVWIIPACNRFAQQNYAKTLTSPINPERVAQSGCSMPPGDLFAWGFPGNPDNLANITMMEPGDICLFYVHKPDGNQYGWAARVRQKFPEQEQAKVSMALWDDGTFLPYLLHRPIQIAASTESLGFSLNETEPYMRKHPYGAMKLADERRATDALAKFGSFEAWAVDFIQVHAVSPLLPGEAVEYFARAAHPEAGGSMPEVDYLFQPKPPRAGVATHAPSRRRHSRQAKIVGDIGEQAVIDHLKATLPVARHESIRWVAQMGQAPGWDIEYVSDAGEAISVEVKATTSPTFPCFEITDNELRAATKLGDRYHLYLVSNCMKPELRKLQIVRNPSKEYEGRFAPMVYRVMG